jgi:uncharacterized RDD family membrane protein YckC
VLTIGLARRYSLGFGIWDLGFGIWDVVFQYIFPFVAVLAFWICKSATLGKMATKLSIVDAKTGGQPTTAKFIVRYLGYFLFSIPLGLGLFWVAFDKRKRGWHEMLAGTVVVRQTVDTPIEFKAK